MANFIEVARKFIRPYYYYIITFVVLIIFIYAGVYAYNTFYANKIANKFSDVANANRANKEVDILFFHVDWCPHCKKALPEWNNFKQNYEGKEVNGYVVKCVDMDCTNETSDITRAINTYKIDSYPTIKMLKENQTIEFDSKITNSSLEQFVNTMLN
jgi:thiol-disulfide isomerase/thioredoxin